MINAGVFGHKCKEKVVDPKPLLLKVLVLVMVNGHRYETTTRGQGSVPSLVRITPAFHLVYGYLMSPKTPMVRCLGRSKLEGLLSPLD